MILLSTTLYEKNFREVLNNESWFLNVKSNLISRKVYIINNIEKKSRPEFELLKKKFQHKANFVESEDIAKQSLQQFNSRMQKNEISWWYSIQYFCQMYLAIKTNTEFVLNVGADCTIEDHDIEDFLTDSIKILREDNQVLLTTIAWEPGDFSEVGNNEQNFHSISKRHKSFWFSKVISDQFFLCSPSKCQCIDFNIRESLHPFPKYGGDTFEKMFTNFIIKNEFYRAIHKGRHYYSHKSFDLEKGNRWFDFIPKQISKIRKSF